jgi:hypothetical protein
MLDKIKWLFVKGQIAKLQLQDGDILVIKPPIGKTWHSEKAKNIHNLMKETLEKFGYKNTHITFVDDVNLGVISKNIN